MPRHATFSFAEFTVFHSLFCLTPLMMIAAAFADAAIDAYAAYAEAYAICAAEGA